jgi:predicted Zn-dependent protease
MNSRTIVAQATNFPNLVTDVLVHEYGHALNLTHNSVNPSIMNENRARNSMIAPQAHDVADVNAYY